MSDKYTQVKEFIEAIASIFRTRIQMFGLNWKEKDMMKVCQDICLTPPHENKVVSVSGYPPIKALFQKSWIKII